MTLSRQDSGQKNPIEEAIRTRRSARRFADRDIEPGVVERLIEAATWAPSAGNLQPWRFFAVRGEAWKTALAEAALGQRFVAQAPVVVVVCAEPGRSATRYGERGRMLYCLQDTAAATQNLLLAAAALGIGSCWVGAFDEEAVSRALGLPPGFRPVAIIPLGYPADGAIGGVDPGSITPGFAAPASVAGGARKRRPLAEVLQFLD